MFGVMISTRKPRSEDYETLTPGVKGMKTAKIAGIEIEIVNTRQTPVYLKWKV